MATFKAGELVKVKLSCSGSVAGNYYFVGNGRNGDPYLIRGGYPISADGIYPEEALLCGCPSYWEKVEQKSEAIKKPNPMTLTEQFALLTKSEPEKSFIKAGITTMDGSFTVEGKALFKTFLVNKFGNEFKTEVVDKILAEQEKAKS